MNKYLVKINWTKYVDPAGESEYLSKTGVLYLLGTFDISLFIGVVDEETTLSERLKVHMDEQTGPTGWLEEHRHDMWYPWDVKVGIPDLGKPYEDRLSEVVSLLVEKEHKRGGCLAQDKQERKQSNSYFPGLIVVNTGDYLPLLNEYFQDTKVFTQKLQPYVLPKQGEHS